MSRGQERDVELARKDGDIDLNRSAAIQAVADDVGQVRGVEREQKGGDIDDHMAAIQAVADDAQRVYSQHAAVEREGENEVELKKLGIASKTLAVALECVGLDYRLNSVHDTKHRMRKACLETTMAVSIGGVCGSVIAKPEDIGAGVVLGSLYVGAVLQSLGNMLTTGKVPSKRIAEAAFFDSNQQNLEAGRRQYRQNFLDTHAAITSEIDKILLNPGTVVIDGIPAFVEVPLEVLYKALSVRGEKSALSKGQGGGFLFGALSLASLVATGAAHYFAINAYDPDSNKGGVLGLKMVLLNVLTFTPCCMAAYKATKITADGLDLRVFKEIVRKGKDDAKTGQILKEAATDALTAFVVAQQMVLDFVQAVPQEEVACPDRQLRNTFFDNVITRVPVTVDPTKRSKLHDSLQRRVAAGQGTAGLDFPVVAQRQDEDTSVSGANESEQKIDDKKPDLKTKSGKRNKNKPDLQRDGSNSSFVGRLNGSDLEIE